MKGVERVISGYDRVMENEGKRKEMKSKMKGNERYPAGYERVMAQHERK